MFFGAVVAADAVTTAAVIIATITTIVVDTVTIAATVVRKMMNDSLTIQTPPLTFLLPIQFNIIIWQCV